MPSSVPEDSFVADVVDRETIRYSWDEPAGGIFDQYALTYSITDRNCASEEVELVTKYFTSETDEYELLVEPGSVVFASIATRSQVSCVNEPTDSVPVIIYGQNSGEFYF